MTERTLASIRPRVSELLQRAAMPGVVIAAARDGHAIEHLAVGTDAQGHALAPDSLFPVASITKLVTALSVLRLVDHGAVDYEERLDAYLPESVAAQAGVTLQMLFTHTSGLQGMEDYDATWTPELTWAVEREAALRLAPAIDPGARVAYADVNYVLLAIVVERVTSQAFPAACRELVLDPLGIEAYFAEEPPRTPAWIGDEPGPHTGTAREWHNSAHFRSLCLPASALVTTAAGALALVRAFAGAPVDFLREETRAAATRDQTGGVGGGHFGALDEAPEHATFPWGLGPELREHRVPHFAPAQAGPVSFGHAGSSGCVAWADPAAGVAWSILGTRHMAAWWGDPMLGDIGAAILGGESGANAEADLSLVAPRRKS
jgi:CubicO group peptidase (beta-lactamase class C family)